MCKRVMVAQHGASESGVVEDDVNCANQILLQPVVAVASPPHHLEGGEAPPAEDWKKLEHKVQRLS